MASVIARPTNPAAYLVHHARLEQFLDKTLLLPEHCHCSPMALDGLEPVGRFDLSIDDEAPGLSEAHVAGKQDKAPGLNEAHVAGTCRGGEEDDRWTTLKPLRKGLKGCTHRGSSGWIRAAFQPRPCT